jgi:hypothetical protein
MKIKRVAAVFLFVSAMAPWLLCKADDGSVMGEMKRPAQNASKKSQKTHLEHRSRVTLAHPERAGFCRDFYCIHASGSPWWPGAPGD